MQKIINFLTDVKGELSNVSWPNRKDTMTSLVVVCIAVVLSSFLFFSVDLLLYKAVQFFIKLGN